MAQISLKSAMCILIKEAAIADNFVMNCIQMEEKGHKTCQNLIPLKVTSFQVVKREYGSLSNERKCFLSSKR